jgi:hypothetical protein
MVKSNPNSQPRDQAGKLARLIRRICLLREIGDDAGASALQEKELPELTESGGADHGEVDALFATEGERAAESAMLAELIIARLTRFPSGRAALSALGPVPEDAAEASSNPPSGPPAIADLLDAMLQHDRKAARAHGRR